MQTSKVCVEVRDGQVSRLRDVTVKQGEITKWLKLNSKD